MSTGSSGGPEFESFEWEDISQDLFSAAGPLDEAMPDSVSSAQPPGTPDQGEQAEVAFEDNPPQSGPDRTGRTPVASASPAASRRRFRRWQIDPLFSYIILMGLSFGLTPLATESPNGRYAAMWALLALVVIASHVMTDGSLEVRLRSDQLLWGAGWGLIVGLPLLLVGPGLLADVSQRIFVAMPDGAVFQTIVFVMATTESAFFRGMIQESRSVLVTSGMASLWSLLLFFPTMDVLGFPFVAVIAGTFIVLLNILYSYVRQRNGTAAAWMTQTLVSLAWLFLPRL